KPVVARVPGEKPGWTRLQVIDAPKWSLRKTLSVAVAGYDVAADDRGRIYVSGGAGGWTDIAAISASSGEVLARWGGIWARSRLRLSADQKRLYIATPVVHPASIDALVLPGRLDEKPALYRSQARNDRDLGADFLL